MATRFLRSKTTPPTLHREVIGRSRLANRIAESQGPLVLVSAPAGYGKTTLLVQALAAHPGRLAWVTIDSADNDPLRFWTHLAAALLDEGSRLDGLVADLGAGADDRQAVIDQLLTTVEEAADNVVLVLDDLHEVVSEEILDALALVVANPPTNLRIIASTRSDPALPTARLRAQGRLTEIRACDLAFTIDEANAIFGGRADPDALQAIVERTEGWPTALRLLEVASTGSRSGEDLLDAAALGNPDLAEFLSEEALTVQRDDVQQFLVETAILDDLVPTVCDAMTRRAGSLSILRELATNQVFTTLVDPTTSTYRYHHLFRDFLRSRGLELPAERRKELAQRAADVYAERGDVSQAIRMALLADNDAMVVDLILTHQAAYSQAGWIATVFEWLKAYGLERCEQHPDLAVMTAWALLNLHRYDEMNYWLEVPALRDPMRQLVMYGPLGAQTAAIRAHWKRHVGDVAGSLAAGEAGQAFDPDPASVANCVVGAARGIAHVLLGGDATVDFERAVTMGLANNIDSSAVVGYSGLAFQASVHAETLDTADAFADQALAFCTTPALVRFHQPALAYIAKARHRRNLGRVGDALDFATQARGIAREAREPLVEILALAELSRVAHLQGDHENSRAHLRHAEALATPSAGEYLADVVRSARNDTRFVSLENLEDLPAGATELTDRELSVVRLLPYELTRKELAAQLFISENTLKTHLTSIRHKLGVSGRSDIATRAAELGIIETTHSL